MGCVRPGFNSQQPDLIKKDTWKVFFLIKKQAMGIEGGAATGSEPGLKKIPEGIYLREFPAARLNNRD